MIFSLFLRWVPALTLLCAIALQELAFPYSAWSALRPDLLLIALFYWRLYRPDRCGPGLAFTTGLMVDAMSTALLGVNAFTKTLLVLLVGNHGNRLRAADFVVLLFVLFGWSVSDQFLQWLLNRVFLTGGDERWELLLGKPVATLLLAPLVIQGLILVHRTWLEEPHAGK